MIAQQFELTRLASATVGQFWFLYALFICLIVPIAVVSAAVAIQSRWGVVTMTCWGLVFFRCGMLLASRQARQSDRAPGPRVALATAIAFVAAAIIGQRFGHYLVDSVKQEVRFADKHLGRSAEVIVAAGEFSGCRSSSSGFGQEGAV
jgi:hypothetical protein